MAFIKNPIPGHENDQIIIFARRHFASMIGTVFIILIMIIIPIFLMNGIKVASPKILSTIAANFIFVIGSIYYLVLAAFVFMQWVSYYYDILIVTDKEVLDIKQIGLFDRQITEISLLRIQDVSAQVNGFWPTLFNYGDVVAESAGENSRTYVIENIGNPIKIANQILQLHTEHIDKEDRAAEIIVAEGDLRGGYRSTPSCPPCEPCQPATSSSSFASSEPLTEIQPNVTVETPFGSSSQSPVENQSQPTYQTEDQAEQGDISKDDLDKGGEVKL